MHSGDLIGYIIRSAKKSASMEETIEPYEVPRQWSFLAFVLLVVPAAAQRQDCALATVKPCVDTLLEQANNNVIAHATNHTLLDTCRRIQEAMECVATYISACSTKAERQQYAETVSSTSGLMDSLCQPGDFQDRFLEHVPCLRLVSMDYHYCGHLYKKTVAHIKRGEDRSATPDVCCTFTEYTNCSRTMSKSLCSSEAAEFVDDYLEQFGGATLTTSCSSYRNGSRPCARSAAPPGRPGHHLTLLLLLLLVTCSVRMVPAASGWSRPLW